MTKVVKKVSFFVLNGRMTNEAFEKGRLVKNKTQYAFSASNYWSSTEYSSSLAWNVNFSSGNINNNNKYNTNVVRPVAALDEKEKEAWIDAFDDCCRRKKSSESCIIYRLCYEEDLWRLAIEIKSRTYYPSKSICFCVTRPKLREVFAANFRDRIVHHWLMLKLNPMFEDRFASHGNVSFNCRKGFGVQFSVQRLRSDIFDISRKYTEDAYIGRFDIVGFFMSINKDILIEQLRLFISEKYIFEDADLVFSTLCIVINHNPSTNCDIHGNKKLFDELPKNKSLFHANRNRGLPIGNLTSQILANFYLSFFDEAIVKWTSGKNGRYIRFVDDFVVIMKNMKHVHEAYVFSSQYLSKKLDVKIHNDKKYIQHYSKGVAFIGYVVKIDRVYLSNRTYGHFYERMRKVDAVCHRIISNNNDLNAIRTLNDSILSINSFIGFTCHTNGYGMRLKCLLSYNKIYHFAFLKTRNHIIKLKKSFKIGEVMYEKDRVERIRISSRIHKKEECRSVAVGNLY